MADRSRRPWRGPSYVSGRDQSDPYTGGTSTGIKTGPGPRCLLPCYHVTTRAGVVMTAKRQVGARIAPEIYRALKLLAAAEDRRIGDLVEEAVTDLVRKYGGKVQHVQAATRKPRTSR